MSSNAQETGVILHVDQGGKSRLCFYVKNKCVAAAQRGLDHLTFEADVKKMTVMACVRQSMISGI